MDLGLELRTRLPTGGLGGTLYSYPSTDSTNLRAAELARQGAPHGTVVVAGEQTEGRGRQGSRWESHPGSSIALSVVLHPPAVSGSRLAGLGALAVAQALEGIGLVPRIKWPNDVLLDGRKVAGVLPEAVFEGNQIRFAVLGIGVNAGRASAPPDSLVDFPATSVEAAAGRRIDRAELIVRILGSLGHWIGESGSASFLAAWERRLAYLGDRVRVEAGGQVLEGVLLGLDPDGAARLRRQDGQEVTGGAEASRMRPVDRRDV